MPTTPYFTFAFVLLAMLLASTITHAQQGNLPVPVQKLPSYPPAVCVTPNWTSESCASRSPTYGPQNEPSGWQCGDVRIIVSSDSTTFFSTEFLITGIETRDSRFKLVKDELYLNGRLCTSFPEHNKTESLPPYPPVTCLKPNGASKPCENRQASPAQSQAAVISIAPGDEAATVSVEGLLTPDDGDQFRAMTNALTKAVVVLSSNGGSIKAGITIGEAIRLKGFHSVVVGRCASACALAWLGGTPRSMAAEAQIGFHAAYNASTGQETAVGNALVGAYLSRIGLPYKAVIYITQAAPTSMTWLTFSEAKQNGIDVTLVDKSTILSRGPSGSGTSTPLDEAQNQ